MELSRALRTVRAMLAKAESLEELGDAHSLHEAQLCREKADKVMQEHGEQEWLAAQAADKAFKPDRIKIDLGAARSLFTGRGIWVSGRDMFVVGFGVAALGYLIGEGLPRLMR